VNAIGDNIFKLFLAFTNPFQNYVNSGCIFQFIFS
jgi:hypothetical protein